MSSTLTMATLEQQVGNEIGVSDWFTLDQPTIDAFAEATGDHQWIHVDVARAKAESPFGGTVAHGFLTLSLLGHWMAAIPVVPDDASSALNYGFDKVRFLAPVPSGARVRDRVSLTAAAAKGEGRVLLTTEHTVEIEGVDKPALIAQFLVMVLP